MSEIETGYRNLNVVIAGLVILVCLEISLPKLLNRTAKPFVALSLKGKSVNFPRDYAGKVVLLDFWATWCGSCMEEVPNVVRNYQRYHDKGFEVLGVSLDDRESARELPAISQSAGMNWAHHLRLSRLVRQGSETL